MPSGIVSAIIAVAVLVTIAAALDWLSAHPTALVLIVAAIAGTMLLWIRRRRARNRV